MKNTASPTSIVYLIDDEPICRQSMRSVLKAFGYQCIDFGTSEEFLKELAQRFDSNDTNWSGLVVADFRLDGMNGLQLFEKTRQLGCDLPFVLISGHADNDLVETSLKAGVSEFLQKPIDFEHLRERIAKLMTVFDN